MRGAGRRAGDRWRCSRSRTQCPALDGKGRTGVASTRRRSFGPDPGHVGDPSSGDPVQRRPGGGHRWHCWEEAASGARPPEAANEPSRVGLRSSDEVHHLGINPPRSGTTARTARLIASARSVRSVMCAALLQPLERLSHGLCSSQRDPEQSSSHPLLSAETHPGFRCRTFPDEMPGTCRPRPGGPTLSGPTVTGRVGALRGQASEVRRPRSRLDQRCTLDMSG